MKTIVSKSASSLLILIAALGLSVTARAGAPGSVDRSFQSKLASYGVSFHNEQWVYTVQRQADGKVLVGGLLANADRTKPSNLFRLNANGSVDTAFNASGTGPNSDVRAIVVLGDGKILIGGSFTAYNGVACNGITRLNANGTVDTRFAPGSGIRGGSVNCIVPLASGKFLVGGDFTTFDGLSTRGIVRMHANGSVDEFFNAGGRGFDGPVWTIKVLSDGNVLAGGGFTGYNGYRREGVAKLSAEGALIFTQFLTGYGANGTVRALLELPDRRVMIGGDFTRYMSSRLPYLTCVDANGLPATDMPALSHVNAGVHNMALQRDGRIVISGNFTTVGGATAPGVARLTTTGAKDGFQAPFTLTAGVDALLVQPDGRILIGGLFDRLESVDTPFVARLANAIPTTGLRFNGIASANSTNNYLGGSFSLLLTNTGSFTGRYVSGTTTVSLTGTMSDASTPRWRGSVTRTTGEVLTFDILYGRDLAGTDMIIGTVSTSAATGAASIVANAAYYDATYIRATHIAGRHTSILGRARTPDASVPNGTSFMTQSIAPNGVVTAAATLADGSVVTATGSLDASDHCVLYMPFGTNRASLCGQLEFLGHDLNVNVTGNFRWRKPAAVATTTDNGLDINEIYQVYGSDYQPALGYGIDPVSAATAALFTLYGGNVEVARSQSVTIRNNTSLAIGTTATEMRLSTLTATASTGAISGTCTVPMLDSTGRMVNRTGTIRGVFVQGLSQGFGWVSLAGSTTTNVRSSAFTITTL